MNHGYFSQDTIVAITTSLAGDGGVGIIRLSGKQALNVAQSLTRNFLKPKPRYLHRIRIYNCRTAKVIDDGLAVFFPEDKSFTGEQVVELQLHGGRFLLHLVLEECLHTGLCRKALPGEFSFRAVKNKRMSLNEAEALKALITAKSPFEIEKLRRKMNQATFSRFERIAERIAHLLSQVELSIDFIDQDVEVISATDLAAELNRLVEETTFLKNQFYLTKKVSNGIKIHFLGKPNAGKSTLFNAVLGEERAIVSEQAGTTRDLISESMILGPYYLTFFDTAGIHAATEMIEKMGIEKAKQNLKESDLNVLIFDATEEADELVRLLRELEIDEIHVDLIVLNKTDLIQPINRQERNIAVKNKVSVPVHSISAKNPDDLHVLKRIIVNLLDRKIGLGDDAFLPSDYQLEAMNECDAALHRARTILTECALTNPEILSVELFAAINAMSQFVGKTTPETILTKIFSEFCIGK